MTPTPPRLGFRKHLRPAVVPGDATYLVSERGVIAVEGDVMAALAPLLDGSRNLSELVGALRGVVAPAQLGSLLGQLTEANLLGSFSSTAHGPQDAATTAFWESAGLDGEQARAGLSAGTVRLVDLTPEGVPAATDAFRAAGVGLSAGGDHTLTVVLCEDYLSPALADIDTEQRRAGAPWLLAKPDGVEPWLGPVFTPSDGACWHCLAHRIRHHRSPQRYVGTALGMQAPLTPPRAHIPASRVCALQLLAFQAAQWLAGLRHESQATVWALDSLGFQGRHHRVDRRPQCPSCGDPGLLASRTRAPVVLASRPKVVTGGGHRALPARRVLERYEHLVGDVTGVVRVLQRDPRCPEGLNSYLSGGNPAVPSEGLGMLRSALRGHSAGKGVTELDAKVGALCEALERYSATFQGDEARTRASFAQLGEAAVHPNLCQLYDERQFAHRREWNAAHTPFQFVCDPLGEDTPLDWTPVWSAAEGRHRMLPTGLLYFAAPPPSGRAAGPVHVRADSNGNAAGSSLEDAVLQGFLELVERDAVALWWYNRTRQPAVDCDSFAEPWITRMRETYAELGRELWVLDITSDLGIPAMCAVSRAVGGPQEDLVFGLGCHLDPALALRRALTEMTQMLPAVLDPALRAEDPTFRDWCAHRTLTDQPYLAPDPEARARVRADYAYNPREDLFDDVCAAVELMRAHGMDVLILDQTRPDLGIPVVKVVVPGLRHFWARFAPGRLYDVPVRLGRRRTPLPYSELNPVPVFV